MGNIKFKAVYKHGLIEIRFSMVSPENNDGIFIFYKYIHLENIHLTYVYFHTNISQYDT